MRIGRDTIKRVSLSEYLSGNCQYGACRYNDCGTCINEDADFLNYVEDLSINIDKNKHERIICEVKFEEGVCVYCGTKMTKVLNKVPYGDTMTTEVLYVCPKC